jgi:hypothetical protein
MPTSIIDIDNPDCTINITAVLQDIIQKNRSCVIVTTFSFSADKKQVTLTYDDAKCQAV